MKKVRKAFWYGFFYVGTTLEHLGDKMTRFGLDKLDELNRNTRSYRHYARKLKVAR